MKAIVQHRFGAPTEVLEMKEIDRPTVGSDDVLVQVQASSANPWDWHFIRAQPYFMRLGPSGLRTPKFPVPGGDLAGIVEEVGSDVSRFAPGDEVYGFGHGAYAEYIAVPQGGIAHKPANLSLEEAAAVPLAAVTALQGLTDVGKLQSGEKALIIGASGGVGSFAVQMAVALGAEVTGVCSTRHVELVRSLGARHVIDYMQEDFTTGDERYDLAFQLGGSDAARAIRRVLAPGGRIVLSSGDGNRWIGPLATLLMSMVMSRFGGPKARILAAREDAATLDRIREMVEAGRVRPVIDSTFPLQDAGAAVALVEQGRPGGKVVVSVV